MTKSMRLLLAGVVFGLYACGGAEKSGETESDMPKTAKGDVVYGGTLHVPEDEKYQTLFPPSIIDAISWHLATNIYEGLVKFHPKHLTVEPAIAKKWEINADQTEYTFSLRKGVYFHDDPCFKGGKGREVQASDVKYSFEVLCTRGVADDNYKNSIKDRIQGAADFYEKKENSIKGIEVVDNYTIKIKLINPSSSFLYILANPICSVIPKEGYEKYGKDTKVGCGPFRYVKYGDETKETYLAKNANYYGVDPNGNRMPFLDTVHFVYVDDISAQLDMFRSGKLSILYGLPAEKITEVLSENMPDFQGKPPKYILERQGEMLTQFYEFNLTRPYFKDVRVRRAMAMSIDRARINEVILNNQAMVTGPKNITGNYGIVPPVALFKGYDTSLTRGYGYNPEFAKKLMRDAGYPNGKNFPTLNIVINSGGARHNKIAYEIANQWNKILGINVEVNTVTMAQKLDDAQYGRGDIFRSAWVADFPSPESFLSIAYGGNVPESMNEPSHPNTMRYQNTEFDTLYMKGVRAQSEEERYKHFAEAESIMLADAPVIILWYGENYKLQHSNVFQYYNNPMNYYDFSPVFLRKARKEDFEGK
jgi:peptide/nickel transport system substrate-binding protein